MEIKYTREEEYGGIQIITVSKIHSECGSKNQVYICSFVALIL